MVLGARARRGGARGRHPGRGGLRAGSSRSIPGEGRAWERAPRVREPEGMGGVREEERVCGEREARAGLDQSPDGRMLRARARVRVCARVCVRVFVCVRVSEGEEGEGEREGTTSQPRHPLDAGPPLGRPTRVASRPLGSAGVSREGAVRGARGWEAGAGRQRAGGREGGRGGGGGSRGGRRRPRAAAGRGDS